MDGEGGSVDGLVALDDVAGLIDENQVRDADLGEVPRERVQPEVVGEDGVAHGNVPGDALVETTGGEAGGLGSARGSDLWGEGVHPEGRGEVLLAVQSLLLEGVEGGIGTDLELLAGGRGA